MKWFDLTFVLKSLFEMRALTEQQIDILHILCACSPNIATSEVIAERLRARGYYRAESASVRVQIHRLRKALKNSKCEIVTKLGCGGGLMLRMK